MQLPVAEPAEVRREVVRLALQHRGALLGTLALHALAAVIALVPAIVIGRLVGEIVAGKTTREGLMLATVALLLAAVAQAVLTKLAHQRSVALGEVIIAALREDLVRDLTRLPLNTVEQASSGDLLSRTTNDVESLVQSVRYAVPRILIVAVTLLITAVTTFALNPAVAAILLLGVPVLTWEIRRYLRLSTPGYRRQMASFATLSGTISETAEGIRTVEALGLEQIRERELDDALRERLQSDLVTLRLRTRFFPAAQLSLTLPVVLVLGWGAFLVSVGWTSIGTVTTIALLAAQLVGPIGELTAWVNQLQMSSAAMARMIGVSLATPARDSSEQEPDSERLRASSVRYAYRAGSDVLKGIDLTLEPGERLAIVGSSGSGKSTLARLLSGVDAPSVGTVTVGGVPLTGLSVQDLRTHVALITQEHHIFVGSVADNLRLGRPDATEALLREALAAVAASSWIEELPEGLETRVGSGGHPLSPAQAQELALARLVLLAPATLVLDEATSLVEPATARFLERSLSALLQGRTVVAVAHRLHSAEEASRIAVMRKGRIVELGTHEDLIAAEGEYAGLWRAWHSG
ncbi:MAG TPA: ABC transporter ATP-binding protein [Naasia sp.]|jgi:ABC-type multidrug transport system fused ATPase/permease subunit